MDKVLAGIGLIVLVVGLVFGIGFLFAFPVKWLINYLFAKTLLTSVFGTETIGVGKAFWLSVLIGLLGFKGSSYREDI